MSALGVLRSSTPGENYSIRTRIAAELRGENNFFRSVQNPWAQCRVRSFLVPRALRPALVRKFHILLQRLTLTAIRGCG
jgi:hypothetical protein